MNLPWEPIYSIERSGRPEITVYGAISVWAGVDQPLISVGSQQEPLWTRSLLKPVQLLCNLPSIRAKYPQLKPHHYALMMSSHNGDPNQLTILDELLDIALINENFLQTPDAFPMSVAQTHEMKRRGQEERPLYHPCAGKHIGMMLGMKGRDRNVANYLDPENEEYDMLARVISTLVGPIPEDRTVDGCGMPNFAMTPFQTARLYAMLARPLPESILKTAPADQAEILSHWDELRTIMWESPLMFGGIGRLDTRLIEGRFSNRRSLNVIAKEGADGLLAVGVESTEQYPEGVGIYIKLASGYDNKHLETIVIEVLTRLGLGRLHLVDPGRCRAHIYHFAVDHDAIPDRV